MATDPRAASIRRALAASLVGTSIEFYDFYVYATAASLVFGELFFSAAPTGIRQIASFATLGVAFIARPLGSVFFGHFGDRVGRKSTLVASLLTMGLSTLLVGLLPTYAQAGWWAPLILCILRFGQGFGLGGEWGGAALLAVENAPPGWRARFGAVPQLGAPVGFILANGLYLLLGIGLSAQQFHDWGWRIPFLLSAVLVGLGLWIRLRLAETAEFAAALRHGPPPAVPVGAVVRHHGGALLGGVFGTIACFVLYYLATAFALGYGTKTLGYPANRFLLVQLGAICVMALTIWLSGWAADRHFDERRMLMAGCVMAILTGCLIQPLMGSGSLGLVFLFLSCCMFAMGFCYGPLGGWLPTLFPPLVRYTGVSAAFNLASILGGGLTPIAAQWLAITHGLVPVGLYCSGLAAISLVALALMGPRAARD